MPIPPRKLRVFLCHASQDKPIVNELYHRLLTEDWIDPWLDARKILPGQDWRTVIEQAVESADIIFVCISINSVNKDGFIQKELRYAREIALEKPEDTIFIVPVLLEECDVPRGLRFLQWAKYYEEEKEQGYLDLLASLRLRQGQIILRDAEELAGRQAEKEAREEGTTGVELAGEKFQTEMLESGQPEANAPTGVVTDRMVLLPIKQPSPIKAQEEMEIVTQTKHIEYVKVTGRVDSSTAPAFSRALENIVHADHFHIAVDMQDVVYMSSAGFRALLAVQRVCKRDGRGEIVLAALPDTIRDALELSGFLDLFRFVEDPKDAF
jgi:anti-anti-sigma factor